jgi:RNA polymerase sigma-54 factor
VPLEVKIQLKTAQKLVMTAMLQQAIKLLPLSRLELVQKVHQEMLENPFLEDASAQEEEEGGTDVAEDGLAQETEEASPPELDVDWEVYLQDSGDDPGFPIDRGKEIPSLEATLKNETSLTDYLFWQLSLAAHSDAEKEIGAYLIGNIDDNGYLQGPPEEVAEALGVDIESVHNMLEAIQSFDPPGLGARDLQECLLIQLGQLDMQD